MRRRPGRPVLAPARVALIAALSAIAGLAAPVAAASGFFVGPWGLTYARYDPRRFGPERPLADLVAGEGLPRDPGGRLAGARLLVIKDERRCELWIGDRMVKAYRIQLSQHSRGAKRNRSDQRTPEGEYRICAHRPSKYHRGLWIDYPGLGDASRALREHRIGESQYRAIADALARGDCPPQNTRLGGLVMLHGQQKSLTASQRRSRRKARSSGRADLQLGDADPGSMRQYHDWTAGCIAMFNPDIRELYDLLPDGTPVTIVGDGAVTVPVP